MNEPITGFEEANEPQLASGHYFRGQKLHPYSFHYRSAMVRLGEGHRCPRYEDSIYLVFLLLTKKPKDVDALRSVESLAAFRDEAAQWADANGVSADEGWGEVDALAQAVIAPVRAAQELVPAASPGTGKKTTGNE